MSNTLGGSLTSTAGVSDAVLFVHILAGVVALLAGIAGILTRKGGNRHNTAGKAYVFSMGVVVVTAAPLSVWIENWFLLAITVFSGYLVFAGYRVIIRRRNQLSGFEWMDYALQGTMLLAGSVMIGGGLFQIGTGTVGLAPVLIIFGAIGITLTTRELTAIRTETTPWIERHIAYMGGAYIATVTATITVNLTMLPPLARWLGPTFIGVPLILYSVQKYRPVFSRSAGTPA